VPLASPAGGDAPSDSALVDRALQGSDDACRLLVERHERAVYNLIVRMVRDPSLAEDLAQETFLKAFRRLHTYDVSFRLSSWLLRIAHNTAIDALRRRRPAPLPLDLVEAGAEAARLPSSGAADSGERLLTQAELARALDRALDRLRPEYRRVVVLRYQEELGVEEIARVVGLPVGTVKSHLHRARAELARDLTEAGWAPSSAGSRAATGRGPTS